MEQTNHLSGAKEARDHFRLLRDDTSGFRVNRKAAEGKCDPARNLDLPEALNFDMKQCTAHRHEWGLVNRQCPV